MLIKFFQLALPVAVAIGLLFSCDRLNADILLLDVGQTVTESYQEYEGNGFAPGAAPATGQLDSNTYRAIGFSDGPGAFGGTYNAGNGHPDFGRGGPFAGGVTEGGAYAFDVGGGDIAVGVQPDDDDFTPGSLTIRVKNDTGRTIDGVRISGLAHFYNDTDSSTLWVFEGSLNDSDYIPFFSRESPQAADGTPDWSGFSIERTIRFPLADQGQFYVRISGDDLFNSGARDEFAISTISFTAIPEPASFCMLSVFFVGALLRRKRNCLN